MRHTHTHEQRLKQSTQHVKCEAEEVERHELLAQ
jgi:hypothetical protein